jgi:hypothetical protein
MYANPMPHVAAPAGFRRERRRRHLRLVVPEAISVPSTLKTRAEIQKHLEGQGMEPSKAKEMAAAFAKA